MNWTPIESTYDMPDEESRVIIWTHNPLVGGMWLEATWLPESNEFERGGDRYPVEYVDAYFIPEDFE